MKGQSPTIPRIPEFAAGFVPWANRDRSIKYFPDLYRVALERYTDNLKDRSDGTWFWNPPSKRNRKRFWPGRYSVPTKERAQKRGPPTVVPGPAGIPATGIFEAWHAKIVIQSRRTI